MTIDINGDVIDEITIDGEFTEEVTVDGEVVFQRTPIPDSVLAQDLVAWYRFEDGDARDYTATLGATFADSTAYDGTVNGATFQSSGGVTDFENGGNSGVYDFDGSNDFINIDNISYGSSASVSFWVKPNSIPNGHAIPISNNDNNETPGFTVSLFENGEWYFYGGTDILGSNVDANINEWQHIVYNISESGTSNVYIDNIFISDAPNTDSVETQYDTNIGCNGRGNDFFDGQIDDVRFYNRALTQSEVSDIYNATEP